MARDVINSFKGEYRWLSNFEPVDVSYEGILYPSTEHAYQAAKTLDLAARKGIALLPTAGAAKRVGKTVKIRPDWDAVKLQVMEDVNRTKYQNPRLRALLLSTVGIELIEGNTWGDVFWGVCGGVGANNLGKVLMKLRDELAAQ